MKTKQNRLKKRKNVKSRVKKGGVMGMGLRYGTILPTEVLASRTNYLQMQKAQITCKDFFLFELLQTVNPNLHFLNKTTLDFDITYPGMKLDEYILRTYDHFFSKNTIENINTETNGKLIIEEYLEKWKMLTYEPNYDNLFQHIAHQLAREINVIKIYLNSALFIPRLQSNNENKQKLLSKLCELISIVSGQINIDNRKLAFLLILLNRNVEIITIIVASIKILSAEGSFLNTGLNGSLFCSENEEDIQRIQDELISLKTYINTIFDLPSHIDITSFFDTCFINNIDVGPKTLIVTSYYMLPLYYKETLIGFWLNTTTSNIIKNTTKTITQFRWLIDHKKMCYLMCQEKLNKELTFLPYVDILEQSDWKVFNFNDQRDSSFHTKSSIIQYNSDDDTFEGYLNPAMNRINKVKPTIVEEEESKQDDKPQNAGYTRKIKHRKYKLINKQNKTHKI